MCTFGDVFEGEALSPEENLASFFARRTTVDVIVEEDFHVVPRQRRDERRRRKRDRWLLLLRWKTFGFENPNVQRIVRP